MRMPCECHANAMPFNNDNSKMMMIMMLVMLMKLMKLMMTIYIYIIITHQNWVNWRGPIWLPGSPYIHRPIHILSHSHMWYIHEILPRAFKMYTFFLICHFRHQTCSLPDWLRFQFLSSGFPPVMFHVCVYQHTTFNGINTNVLATHPVRYHVRH